MVWDPFDEMYRMYEEMDRFFNRAFRSSRPLIESKEKGKSLTKKDFRMPIADIKETEKNVLATFELPGADKKDIELNITDDRIEVKVEKKEEREVKDKGSYIYSSASSHFYRSLPIPAEVNPEKAKASYKNGILRIEVPKTKKLQKSKKIMIE